MGADLYIKEIHDKQKIKYSPLCDRWVVARTRAEEANNEAEVDKAQAKVTKYYDLMYSEGYYRDSYNNWNLLWQFDLDYGVIFSKLLDKEGNLTPAKAKKLLDMLKAKEGVFKANMEGLLNDTNKIWDYRRISKVSLETLKRPVHEPNKDFNLKDRPNAVMYYQAHYKELKGFLNTAIKLDTPIECSI